MEIFSERLRERAKELGLPDAEIARRAGLQEARYNHYVNARREPDLRTLVRICEVLDLTPNDLLGFGDVADVGDQESDSERSKKRILAALNMLNEEQLSIVAKQVEAFVQGDLDKSD